MSETYVKMFLFFKVLLKYVPLFQETLQLCLVGLLCTVSRPGGGMETQTMRTPSNRRASHPAKNMTPPFQVGQTLILVSRLPYQRAHHPLVPLISTCRTENGTCISFNV